MRVNEIKLQKIVTSLLQESSSLPIHDMARSIRRLPQLLRDRFPEIGCSVIVGGKKILPFDLEKWGDENIVVAQDDEISFCLHVGSEFQGKLPTKKELSDIKQFINDFLSRRGWYIFNFDSGFDGETLYIRSLSKNNKIIDVPQILWHLTDQRSLDNIFKKGLIPRKSEERGYSPRVYLFTDKDSLVEQIKNNRIAWESYWHQTLTKTPEMAVVVVDKSLLRKGTKFEHDPEFSGHIGAVYTKSHIPPEAIIDIVMIDSDAFSSLDKKLK